MGTVLVLLVVAAAVVLIVRHLIKNKKNGAVCSGGCTHCAMSDECRTRKDEK